MYCSNCGSTILENSVVCLNCGVKAGTGNKFCPQCGAQPDPQAIICIKCGAMLKKHAQGGNSNQQNEVVNDFGVAIKVCFNKYAVFSGRANKSEYWFWYLFNLILCFIPGVNLVAMIGLLIPNIAVAVRRLHDIGKSGVWVLISLIPLAGAVWLIVLLCQDSVEGENEYGPNPNY